MLQSIYFSNHANKTLNDFTIIWGECLQLLYFICVFLCIKIFELHLLQQENEHNKKIFFL